MESVSVIYLRKETILDIPTKDKLQTAVLKITKVIANKIKPLYRIAFILLYDAKEREQIFEEELYNAIDSNVKKYIYNNVYHYISENDKINIEGFIIFRLKLLWDIIDSTIRQFIEYNFSLNELLNQITENSKWVFTSSVISFQIFQAESTPVSKLVPQGSLPLKDKAGILSPLCKEPPARPCL